MSFNVTQCPACESTFNTNSRVLAAAAGRVRCGACLNIFEAIDNFLIPEPGEAQDQDESVFVGNDPQEFFDPSSFLTRSALREAPDDDAVRRESIEEETLHQELEQSETVGEDFFATVAGELQESTEAPAFENEPEVAAKEQLIDRPEDLTSGVAKESTESFLGSSLSASFTFDPHAQRVVRTNVEVVDTHADSETASELPIESSISHTESQFGADNEDLELNAQADTLEQDTQAPYASEWSLVDDEQPEPPTNDEAAHFFSAEDAGSEPLASATEVDEDSTEAIRARALEAELRDDEALEAIPRENLAVLGLMSTPLEFFARKESRLLRSTLLFISILLLSGLLSAQYLWQRMELYSQLPQLRPLYEVTCTYLNCTLPDYADISSIRSENLTVQTHPSFANGLMVNTVVRNTAAFEQPFPILILSFNSIENNVIALREFTSAEYLDPGLSSIQAMPSMTPVQISLAIMDPGPGAVNYTLAFRWP